MYETVALPVVALVFNPRAGGFAYILRPCRSFKHSFLKIWQFLPLPQPPELWGFIFLVLEPWAVWSGLGLGYLTPRISFLIFIHHAWMWDHLWPFCSCHLSLSHHVSWPLCPISASQPLITVWMMVVSLSPWLSDFHTAWFSDSSGCYLFWDLVVILFCGCVRRWSMSAYASILTRSSATIFLKLCTIKLWEGKGRDMKRDECVYHLPVLYVAIPELTCQYSLIRCT